LIGVFPLMRHAPDLPKPHSCFRKDEFFSKSASETLGTFPMPQIC